MLILSLFGLAFDTAFTALALGLAILTLLLLVEPLLLIPARVAALAFNCRDFIRIMFARAIMN